MTDKAPSMMRQFNCQRADGYIIITSPNFDRTLLLQFPPLPFIKYAYTSSFFI